RRSLISPMRLSAASESGSKRTSTSTVDCRHPCRTAVAPPVRYMRVPAGTARPSSWANRLICSASAALRTFRRRGEAGHACDDRVVAGVSPIAELLAQLAVELMRRGCVQLHAGGFQSGPPQAWRRALDGACADASATVLEVLDARQDDLRARQAFQLLGG